MANDTRKFPNDQALFAGFRLGLYIGAVVAFFRMPRFYLPDRLRKASDQNSVRLPGGKLSDPIAESIAEGKEAARRRRSELGLDKDSRLYRK